jgi:hypothetical protein
MPLRRGLPYRFAPVNAQPSDKPRTSSPPNGEAPVARVPLMQRLGGSHSLASHGERQRLRLIPPAANVAIFAIHDRSRIRVARDVELNHPVGQVQICHTPKHRMATVLNDAEWPSGDSSLVGPLPSAA